MPESLTGTGTLVRLIMRRDRLYLPIWIGSIVAFIAGTAASFPFLYGSESERQARADLMQNPFTSALSGPGHGSDDYTFGAMLANEILSIAAIAVALMSMFLVVRHTRSDEEAGRTELLRAAVVGRHASTAAVITVALASHLLIAVFLTALLPLINDDYRGLGALAFGLSLATVGFVFGGVAVVSAQLTQSSRGAVAYGIAALGCAYTMRALGDAGLGPFSWFSPFGWAQATRSFVDERWWPLGPSLAVTVSLMLLGLLLASRRDVGAGLLPPRPGPPGAGAFLAHPLGLAFRMQRGMLLAWGVGLLLFGLAYGSLIGEVDAFAEEFPVIADWIAESGDYTFSEFFVAMLAAFLALLAAAAGVQGASQLRGEEAAGRAEPLMATAMARWRWIAGYVAVALLGSTIILVLSGVGMGVTAAATTGEGKWLVSIPAAVFVHVPALSVTVGLAVALFGLTPRLAGLAWGLLGYALVVLMLGGLLNFPGWLEALSPFSHTPPIPAADVDAVPIVLLSALAVTLVVAGIEGFRRRDIGAA